MKKSTLIIGSLLVVFVLWAVGLNIHGRRIHTLREGTVESIEFLPGNGFNRATVVHFDNGVIDLIRGEFYVLQRGDRIRIINHKGGYSTVTFRQE